MPTELWKNWTTKYEIDFLKSIGTYKSTPSTFTRKELLRKYRDAMKLRVNWDSINPDKVKEYLAGEI